MLLVLENTEVRGGTVEVGAWVEGWPQDAQLTQVYGQQSVTGSIHTGWDLGISYKPVYNPAHGKVDGCYTWGTFGNWITVYHGFDEVLMTDIWACYAHLSEFRVVPGQEVVPGDILGISGNTGQSTGAHLHWCFSMDRYISGDYRRCYDPYIFIQRAQEETGMMAEYERGLLGIANGDFKTMLSAYETLDKAGYFANVNKSDGEAPPYNPGDDTATELNASLVRSKRISFLACDRENGPKAWNVVK